MPPDSAIDTKIPVDETDPCIQADGSGAIKELRTELRVMHRAAAPFLITPARAAYWTQVWELAVIRAALRVASNRKQFYGFRLTAIIAAIIVPSLVGLNLSGTGGAAVRWVTFALSLIAALSAAILTLFRFGDRWLMYRTLSNELTNAGWAMVGSPHTDLDKPWSAFTTATNTAIAKYDAEYATEVITATQPKSENQSDGRAGQEPVAGAAGNRNETNGDGV